MLPVPVPARGADAGGGPNFVPLGSVAHIRLAEGPNEILRGEGKRLIVVHRPDSSGAAQGEVLCCPARS